jgi:outer membrane protein insertion porin family
MFYMRRLAIAVFCLWTFVGIIVPSSLSAAERISQIRIEGAERIDPATVMTYLEVQVGDEFSAYNLNRSLKTLYGTGLFADVLLYQEGRELVVQVTENPIINEIAFEGNDKVKDEDLEREISMRSRTVLTRSKIQNDVERLMEVYRRSGRFAAQVDPKIIRLDQNRVNLVFEINEGPETRIRGINFVGNKKFSDSKLERAISSKESRWYRFMTANDRYDPDRLAYDRELLRRFYLDHGYADFQIEAAMAELSPDQKDFFVTFTVNEGDRYRINSVNVMSRIPDLNTEGLAKIVEFKAGDWYDAGKVEQGILDLTEYVGNKQYAFVDIRPKIDRNRSEQTIDITYVINESSKVFVERINVNGNVRTLDEVVRREITLMEGDPYNTAKLQRSEQKVRNLDFFETVKVETRPGTSPDKTVIDVDVQEKSTGELSVGAGFSTSDGPLAEFRIRERNLLGRGQDLSFATTIAGERSEFDLSFTEPYFLDRNISTGVDLFHITRNQDELSYDQTKTGAGFRLGYPVAKNWRQNLEYRIEENEITDVDSDSSRFIIEQEGERTTSAISQRLVYDTRDSIIQPTEGLITRFETEVAGIGGDARYVSNRLGANYFYPIRDQWVLSVLGEAGLVFGYGDEDVEINERFYLGGSSLRGFERSGVGPRDTDTDDSLGGNRFYRGSTELAFPSGLPEDLGIRGHIFTDFGSLWDVDDSGAGVEDKGSLRMSFGGGISWRSPLGPVRVDLAKPVIKEDYDEEELFRFSFGTSF